MAVTLMDEANVHLEKMKAHTDCCGTPLVRRLVAAVDDMMPFVAIWAVQYQRDYALDGLHPVHYALLEQAGARMDSFRVATNARPLGVFREDALSQHKIEI